MCICLTFNHNYFYLKTVVLKIIIFRIALSFAFRKQNWINRKSHNFCASYIWCPKIRKKSASVNVVATNLFIYHSLSLYTSFNTHTYTKCVYDFGLPILPSLSALTLVNNFKLSYNWYTRMLLEIYCSMFFIDNELHSIRLQEHQNNSGIIFYIGLLYLQKIRLQRVLMI